MKHATRCLADEEIVSSIITELYPVTPRDLVSACRNEKDNVETVKFILSMTATSPAKDLQECIVQALTITRVSTTNISAKTVNLLRKKPHEFGALLDTFPAARCYRVYTVTCAVEAWSLSQTMHCVSSEGGGFQAHKISSGLSCTRHVQSGKTLPRNPIPTSLPVPCSTRICHFRYIQSDVGGQQQRCFSTMLALFPINIALNIGFGFTDSTPSCARTHPIAEPFPHGDLVQILQILVYIIAINILLHIYQL
ncbi:hypothetical protein Pelo_16681 [Pelomyxa schiedti]|nr:hypothetical protein Pelo_16681 [Pelomyxa schiedti]